MKRASRIKRLIQSYKEVQKLEKEVALEGGAILTPKHLPLLAEARDKFHSSLRTYLFSEDRNKHRRLDEGSIKPESLAMRQWREQNADKLRVEIRKLLTE